MEVTTFTVAGPQAHFRKFYGTNTALSYYLPPRTTLMGLLAARCGWGRGSYHERLSPARLRIGVGAEVELKKTFHRVNNLKVEGPSDFRGAKGRQQTPLELVTGRHFGRDEVRYRVYLAPGEAEDAREVYDEVVAALRTAPAGAYGCCLGAAFCLAVIREVGTLEAEVLSAGSRLRLSTAVAAEAIAQFWRKPKDGPAEALLSDYRRGVPNQLHLEEEIYPQAYARDGERATSAVLRCVSPTGGTPAVVSLTGSEAYRVSLPEASAGGADAVRDFTFLEPPASD